MNKRICTVFCILLTSSAISMQAQESTNKKGWKLEWEENFDQKDSFDTERWSKIPRGTADWDNLMSDHEACYDMHDGNLILRGIKNPDKKLDSVPYLTGGVWTKDKVAFRDGRIEIKAKLGEATGAWPAIWMLSQHNGWPNGGELDIMEHLNYDSIVYQTVHTAYTLSTEKKDPPNSNVNVLKRNDYNVYALEFNADSLAFYTNDKLTLMYPRVEPAIENQYPFDDDFYLLIDMQLGGSWVGEVKAKDLPIEMAIDWVRFYKREE